MSTHEIFSTPSLGPAEDRVLTRIDDLRHRTSALIQVPTRWHGSVRQVLLAESIRGSNTIEGFHITTDDAIAAVERQERVAADATSWAALTGYRDAMTYVLQLGSAEDFAFTNDLLRGLHFMMQSYDLSKMPGQYRSRAVSVVETATGTVVYEGPPADLARELMEVLLERLNTDAFHEHEIVRGAMAHLNLAMIHPFVDGNGRMARGLESLVLARSGVLAPPYASIEEYLGRHTREYYQVLTDVGQGKWTPARDTLPWVRFNLTAHYRQAVQVNLELDHAAGLWASLEDLVDRRSLPERTLYALFDAARGLRVRNATYRQVAEISMNTASRDLKALADMGLLDAVGEKRGRSYLAGERLHEFGGLRRFPDRPDIDPFEVE